MNIQKYMNNLDLPATAQVSSLDSLRIVSDSQRHRILTLLIREPLTASEIAKRLKIARTRVYYHLDLLQEHGFIRVVHERPVAAMIERTYRACAQRFKVDRGVLAAASSESAVNDAQAALLERTADDLRAHHDASDGEGTSADVLVSRAFLRLSPQRAAELRAALVDLVDSYTGIAETDGASYEFAIAFFTNEEERS